MRILMVNAFHYVRGGSDRCFFELTKLLENHGHEVIPFSTKDERNIPSPYDAYFVSKMDFPAMLAQGSSWRSKAQVAERVIYSHEAKDNIARLVDAVQPDVAHLHNIAHELSPAILPPLKDSGIPVVQTLHDYKLVCPNTNMLSQGQICERCKGHRYFNAVRYRCKRDSIAASLLAAMESYIHKGLKIYENHVDVYVSPSRFLANKLADFGVQTPVVQIPNFVDSNTFVPHYGADDYFVYSGRLSEVKGVATLLKAMQQVKRSHLFVAGSGELDAVLRGMVASEQMTNVTFLGHLDREDLVSLIQRARFTVVPSEWYENYPMSVIESLACGTPVIGSNIGGIPECVVTGETGFLFEPGNADDLAAKINYLLDYPAEAEAMGRTGRTQVERVNDPEEHFQRTLALYETLL